MAGEVHENILHCHSSFEPVSKQSNEMLAMSETTQDTFTLYSLRQSSAVSVKIRGGLQLQSLFFSDRAPVRRDVAERDGRVGHGLVRGGLRGPDLGREEADEAEVGVAEADEEEDGVGHRRGAGHRGGDGASICVIGRPGRHAKVKQSEIVGSWWIPITQENIWVQIIACGSETNGRNE